MTTFTPKPLQTTILQYGQTTNIDGVEAIMYPVRTFAGAGIIATLLTDRVIEITGLAGAGFPTQVEISNVTRVDGFRLIIKDTTGFASKDQPIFIAPENPAATIDGNPFVLINSPFGSLELECDGINFRSIGGVRYSPFSPPTPFERDVELSGTAANRDVVFLPSDPALADTIEIQFDNTNGAGYPFVRCSGTGTATISSMVVSAQNSTQSVTTTPDSPGTLAVPAATNVYFSSDGTAANAFTFEEINSSATIEFTIEGFGTCAMPPQRIYMNIISQGNSGSPNFATIAKLTGSFRSAQFFELD